MRKNNKKITISKKTLGLKKIHLFILLIVAGLLLLIAQTSWWISHTIYDSKEFATITTTALTSDSSRDAISKEIVDRAFSNKPLLRATVGKTTAKLLSSVLATDIASTAIEQSTERIQTVLTSSNRDPVELNLVPFKSVLVVISNIAEKSDRQINFKASDIPDKITLLNKENLPELYKIYRLMLILGPLCMAGVVAIFGYIAYKFKDNIYRATLIIGGTLSVTSLIALVSGPIIRPPVLSLIDSVNTRVIIGNLYDGFLQPYNTQLTIMTIIGVMIMFISVIKLGYISEVFNRLRAKTN